MSLERTIRHELPESQWRLLRRALESRIVEVHKWREIQAENAGIAAECDREMQACYDLIEVIKLKGEVV